MKNAFLFLLFVLSACGGSLSDEQRKKIRENMAHGEIKKVTEAELTEAAYEYGRSIIKSIENKDKFFANDKLIDSTEEVYGVTISSLKTGDSALMEIEKQIIEAYTAGNSPDLPDNIQKLGKDSLLYTKPVLREMPDGSVQFEKAIGIRLSKKQVILSIQKK